ncbi:response regulator [Magnetospirillum molischianum]|uniref:response regulator n=1 Tax=Magnetospirillum molischianum TaxID=1083 RepID=UPI0012DC0992|nr:response regulator [Magnetospirillum molischianum]
MLLAWDSPRFAATTARSRILVVDDNDVSRTVAADLLERSGHSVVTAVDGPSAIAVARDGRFDLILLDMQMPGMDGIEAAEVIRACPGAAGTVPIVLFTATPVASDEPRWRRAGIQGCLSKPFRIDRLVDLLASPVSPALLSESSLPLVALSDLALDLGALGHDRMAGLADLFRHSSGVDLERLLILTGEGKVGEAGAVAHRMAGAAASLHLHPLSTLCREIDVAARNQDLGAVAPLVKEVSALWHRSLDALVLALDEAE